MTAIETIAIESRNLANGCEGVSTFGMTTAGNAGAIACTARTGGTRSPRAQLDACKTGAADFGMTERGDLDAIALVF